MFLFMFPFFYSFFVLLSLGSFVSLGRPFSYATVSFLFVFFYDCFHTCLTIGPYSKILNWRWCTIKYNSSVFYFYFCHLLRQKNCDKKKDPLSSLKPLFVTCIALKNGKQCSDSFSYINALF